MYKRQAVDRLWPPATRVGVGPVGHDDDDEDAHHRHHHHDGQHVHEHAGEGGKMCIRDRLVATGTEGWPVEYADGTPAPAAVAALRLRSPLPATAIKSRRNLVIVPPPHCAWHGARG